LRVPRTEPGARRGMPTAAPREPYPEAQPADPPVALARELDPTGSLPILLTADEAVAINDQLVQRREGLVDTAELVPAQVADSLAYRKMNQLLRLPRVGRAEELDPRRKLTENI